MTKGDFTEQAGAYAVARPSYPEALVDRLCARAGVRAGDAVADVGAGTGLFTRALAARGLDVTAVEPNAAMRAKAPALPGVRWQEGSFEAPALPAASQRWIVAAHAFHWADPARALPALRRALAPGGALTVLWNVRDEEASEVLALTRREIEAMAPGFDEGYRDRDWAAVLASTGEFGDVALDEERHVIPMSAGRYAELWRSHHLLKRAIGEAGLERFLAAIDAHLRGADVEVPYVCRAWTARAR